MPPKPRMRPFPLPFSIGTDICHIPRIAALLKKNNGAFTVKLLKKVLSPIEQDLYHKRIFIGYAIADRLGGLEYYLWRGLPRMPPGHPTQSHSLNRTAPGSEQPAHELGRRGLDSQKPRESLETLAEFWRNMSEDVLNNNVNRLATWLAGRWAAKEAVIKAHHWRRLTMHDINIYRPQIKNGITMAPIVTVMAMDQGFTHRAQEQKTSGKEDTPHNIDVANEKDIFPSLGENLLKDNKDAPLQQQVKVSISHDGEYATAVCLAANEIL